MNSENALKERLIKQLGSKDMNDTWEAVDLLDKHGWLTDGSLRGIIVSGANMFEVFAYKASFPEVDFSEANLEGADFSNTTCSDAKFNKARMIGIMLIAANFDRATFDEADLYAARLDGSAQHTSFIKANLEEAVLAGEFENAIFEEANLHKAELWGNFRKADFRKANLKQANLQNATFDEETILPDGSHWTSDTKLDQFTS